MRAWVVDSSLIPVVRKFLGTAVAMSSGASLRAPSFARRSASSLPWSPEWPSIHLKIVGAALRCRWYAAAWNHVLLETLVQPWFSQVVRCSVRPSRAYHELVMQVRGDSGFDNWSATTSTASSPAWLDCSMPGTRMAWFRGWPSPTYCSHF